MSSVVANTIARAGMGSAEMRAHLHCTRFVVSYQASLRIPCEQLRGSSGLPVPNVRFQPSL